MRVRRWSESGDYVFGRGSFDFLVDSPDAVAQSVKTRLALSTGEWFLDTEEGTPWLRDILGSGNEQSYGPALRARILETPGVKEILSFDDAFDRENRKITITITIDTIYGQTSLSEQIAMDA